MPTIEYQGKTIEVDEDGYIIINTLEKPDYDWRTIDGIAAETSLPTDKIEQTLSKLQNDDIVIQSTRLNPKGHAMFTTLNHYRERHGVISRLLTAISGRL